MPGHMHIKHCTMVLSFSIGFRFHWRTQASFDVGCPRVLRTVHIVYWIEGQLLGGAGGGLLLTKLWTKSTTLWKEVQGVALKGSCFPWIFLWSRRQKTQEN